MVFLAPCVEPAIPEFHTHQGFVITHKFFHLPELPLSGRTEISRGKRVPHYARLEDRLAPRTVRGHKWDGYSKLPHGVPQEFKVRRVVAVIAILVFYLHQNYISALVDLIRRKLRDKHAVIFPYRVKVRLVRTAKPHISVFEKPCGKSAEFPFRADIGRGTNYHIQPQLLCGFDKSANIPRAVPQKFSFIRLVEIPRNVGLDGVTAHIYQLLQTVAPVFGNCPEIVYRSRNYFKRFVVQIKFVLDFKGHDFSSRIILIIC